MKNYLIILLLFLSVGFSQQLIKGVDTDEDGTVKITYYKETQNGIEIVKYEGYYKDGQKKWEGTYKGVNFKGEPIKDGLWTWWRWNGQKKKEGSYKDGEKDGLWTLWYENGQKKSESTYKDGEKDGLLTRWRENGQKEIEWTWKDGKKEGLFIKWYENGQKNSEYTFKDGKLISSKNWFSDGSVWE